MIRIFGMSLLTANLSPMLVDEPIQ